jgi:uncharacterized cofD-like protein
METLNGEIDGPKHRNCPDRRVLEADQTGQDAVRRSAPPLRVATLGGGNGIPNVLRGLSALARAGLALEITAIVATADDGGSSGRIRSQRGGLPPGDLRNCLLALADDAEGAFGRLFSHRYDGRGELAGHSLGNLLLIALAEQQGCYVKAVEAAGRMLRTRGQVLPASAGALRLEGETIAGERISGESRIGAAPAAIRRVWLDPETAEPGHGVLKALAAADLVVLGPGSLFTSILPVLLVRGVAETVRASRGIRVLVGNLMTQPGETVGMTMADHLDAIDRHAGAELVDTVLLNATAIAPHRLRPYAEQHAELVSREGLAERPETIHDVPLVNASGKIRHDPSRLADALVRLASVAAEVSPRTCPGSSVSSSGGSLPR